MILTVERFDEPLEPIIDFEKGPLGHVPVVRRYRQDGFVKAWIVFDHAVESLDDRLAVNGAFLETRSLTLEGFGVAILSAVSFTEYRKTVKIGLEFYVDEWDRVPIEVGTKLYLEVGELTVAETVN